MANNTVNEFARELKVSADTLLSQLKAAGVQVKTVNDEISDADKRQLLDSLRQERVAAPRKITVTRRETSTIRQNDGQGGARTIEVEVRRRRVFVKNRAAEAMRAEIEAQAKAQLDRELKEKQEAEAAEAAKREAEAKLAAEEAAKKAAEEAAAKKAAEEKAAAEKAAAEKAAAEAAARQAEADKLAAEKAAAEKAAAEKARQAQAEAEKKAQREAEAAKKAAAEKAAAEKAAAEKAELEARRQEARRKAQEEAEAIRAMLAKPKTVLKAKADRGDKTDRNEEAKKAQPQNAQQKPAQKNQKAEKPAANKPEKNEGKANGKGRKQAAKGNDRWGDEDRGGRRGGMKTRGAVDSDESSGWHSRGRKSHKHEQRQVQMPTEPVVREVTVPETISVADLAHKMSVKATEVIKTLMKMGQMVTINQMLDQETAMIIVEEMGHKALAAKADDPESLLGELESNLEQYPEVPRPPVVTIMGHVDHGKTSLLDYIRNSRVTAGEAGGITQHIGAYTVKMNGRDITFLDTPGHEAFTAMRARGAQATDIAILVVAADDSVMPQTIEAINHAKAANVPIIVAINKMDKPEADPERVKTDLTKYGIVCEDWGGDTIMCPVSAKTGEGVDELLEMILLQADTMELRANPNRLGRGVIIEAKLDKARGPLATVLMQNGTLHVGDNIIAGLASGRVRALINDRGEKVKEAGPSTPVEIMGFDEVPSAGDEMQAVGDDRLSRQVAEERKAKVKASREATMAKVSLENMFSNMESGKQTTLNLIIKADVQGSVEAVKQAMEKLSSDEVKVHVLHSAAGAITKDDVNLASAFNAIIIGFNIRPDASAREAAEREKVDVRLYTVIYKAIEDMELAMKGLLAPEYREVLLGHAEVRNVFKITGAGVIAGCYVTDGKVQRNAQVRLLRDNVVVFEGKLSSLKHYKEDVKEMAAGFECGMSLEGHNDIKEGDVVECFIMEEIPR